MWKVHKCIATKFRKYLASKPPAWTRNMTIHARENVLCSQVLKVVRRSTCKLLPIFSKDAMKSISFTEWMHSIMFMIREIHNVFFIYKYSTLIVVVVCLFIMTCAYTFLDDVSTLISINLSPGLRAFTPLKKHYRWKKRERKI